MIDIEEIARQLARELAGQGELTIDEQNARFDLAEQIGWKRLSDAAERLGVKPVGHRHDASKIAGELSWHLGTGRIAGHGSISRADWTAMLSSLDSAAITPDQLMDTDDLAALLGVTASTLRAMRAQPERHRRIDGMPDPIRLVSRAPVWDAAAVRAWNRGRVTVRQSRLGE